MSFFLGPNAVAAGYRLFAHDSIGSTNVEAMGLARQGDRGGVWVAAREQSAGIGRRGRKWFTPRGNLAASVLTVTRAPADRAATLGFAAGLSLVDGLSRIAPDLGVDAALDGLAGRNARLALKWPNDLVAGSAKIAGILLQAENLADGRIAVVVGIGVNVTNAPDGLPYPTTSLRQMGVDVAPEEVLAELAESWLVYERLWNHGAGLPEIRDLWLERAGGVGGDVAVRSDGEVIRGRFETIDDDGCLIVRGSDGIRRRITAGEVHFGAMASLGTAG